jgi:hypothetical protein
MSTQTEAMKLAIEVFDGNWHDEIVDTDWADKANNAITALREALAEQPAQQAPDYAWPTIEDYEKEVGFEVNIAFRSAWTVARTTNDLFKQMGSDT